MMEKKILFYIGVLIILFISIAIAVGDFNFTGKSVSELEDNYSYTKAICNTNKECIDVLIVCENKKVKSLEPIGDIVKFGEDWEDFRAKEEFC